MPPCGQVWRSRSPTPSGRLSRAVLVSLPVTRHCGRVAIVTPPRPESRLAELNVQKRLLHKQNPSAFSGALPQPLLGSACSPPSWGRVGEPSRTLRPRALYCMTRAAPLPEVFPGPLPNPTLWVSQSSPCFSQGLSRGSLSSLPEFPVWLSPAGLDPHLLLVLPPIPAPTFCPSWGAACFPSAGARCAVRLCSPWGRPA